MTSLGTEAKRLQEIHTDQAPQIEVKQREIEENWQSLREKVVFYFLCKVKCFCIESVT